MLRTPLGNPACSARSMMAMAERGVSRDGFTTQVHPDAMAAPTFRFEWQEFNLEIII